MISMNMLCKRPAPVSRTIDATGYCIQMAACCQSPIFKGTAFAKKRSLPSSMGWVFAVTCAEECTQKLCQFRNVVRTARIAETRVEVAVARSSRNAYGVSHVDVHKESLSTSNRRDFTI